MPWVRAELRGQKVFARADNSGALRVDKGRVEIRYRASDVRRYMARPDNVKVVDPTPLPDSTCAAEAAPVPSARRSATPARRASKSGESAIGTGHEPVVDGNAVVVYADGACSGNPGPAGLGVVVIDRSERIELSEYLGEGTNNIAELTAVQRGVELVADEAAPIVIHTDSSYAIGVLQKGWKAKANVALVQDVKATLEARRNVRLVYVPGHAGVPLNERADELARRAVKDRRTVRTVVAR